MRPSQFFLTLLAAGLTASAVRAEPRTLALGAQAPEFTLPGVDGKDHSLKDFAAAKALVVVFTCNHCPTAQMYEERLQKIASDYRSKGVALVAISSNDPKSLRLNEMGWTDLGDSFAEMKIRAKDKKFDFPYLYDGDKEEVGQAYGPVSTPHAFLFDGERKLRYVGRIDDGERPAQAKVHYLRDAIDAVLAGKEPPVTQTKAVGCSIKWAGKAEAVKEYMEKLAAEPVTVDPVGVDGLKALRANKSGKFRLVSFWATWCAPCQAEFGELVTLHRMYGHRPFEVVTVSLNRPEEKDKVLGFLKEQQAAVKNLILDSDKREPLIEAFDAKWQGEVPFTVLIDEEGKEIYRESGSLDVMALRRAILKGMNEKHPW